MTRDIADRIGFDGSMSRDIADRPSKPIPSDRL